MNLQYAAGTMSNFRPVSERKFVSLLRIAYVSVRSGRFITVGLRDGGKLFMEVERDYDVMWLYTRRYLRDWKRVSMGVWAHPCAVFVTCENLGVGWTRTYASVHEALASGRVFPSPEFALKREGLTVTFRNLSYTADCEENAQSAYEELSDWLALMQP